MVYGLIGTIGSGKSTVLKMIENQCSCLTIQADHIGHAILKEPNIIEAIVAIFGDTILNNNNTINRKALGHIVFHDEKALKRLNQIMHPIMKERLQKIINANLKVYDIIIVEAAILIEANWLDLVEEVILVTCHMDVRINRLVHQRGMTQEDALKVIEKQFKETELLKYSHIIIDNSGDLENTKKQIEKIF